MPTRSPGARFPAPKRRTVTRSGTTPPSVSRRIPTSISAEILDVDDRPGDADTVGAHLDLFRAQHDPGGALYVAADEGYLAERATGTHR